MSTNRRSVLKGIAAAIAGTAAGHMPVAAALRDPKLSPAIFKGASAWLSIGRNAGGDAAPYRRPGHFTVYWSGHNGIRSGLYNIPESDIVLVVSRVCDQPNNPDLTFYVSDVPGAGYARENCDIEYIDSDDELEPTRAPKSLAQELEEVLAADDEDWHGWP